MAAKQNEKPETTTPPTPGKETASATTAPQPETKPPELQPEGEDRTPRRDMAQRVGRALAHLERIHGGPILALVVQNLARDLAHDGSPEDDEFEILEAMLQELGQHDNLAHLAAAQKALAQ